MKTTSSVLPVAVLILAGAWIGMQRHSIAKLEKESALLGKYLAVGPADDTAMVNSGPRDKPNLPKGPIHWKDVALRMLEMRQDDIDAYRELWNDWQNRLSDMSGEELTAALDQIEAPDFPAESRELLELMFIDPLIRKIPEVALVRFSDRLNGKPDGIAWELARALEGRARKDRIAAVRWFDEQVAAGTFHNKTLSGKSQILMKFEGFLFSVLMSADPEDAARRVVAIPEEQRSEILSPLKFGTIWGEDHLAYANLVRSSQLPESKQLGLLAWRVENLPVGDDYSAAAAYLGKIHATPAERSACVERAIQTRIEKLGETRKITRRDFDQLREWTRTQAPELTEQVTGNSLAAALRVRNSIEFPEAAALAADYQRASGKDEVIVRLLSRWNGPDSAGEARVLAGKIADEKSRTAILERIRMMENPR